MLTGKPPFTGDSPVSVALQHVEAKVPAVRDKNPEIPVEIENLIAKALAKSPDMRFQSADEMLKSIRQFQVITVSKGQRLNLLQKVMSDWPGGRSPKSTSQYSS